MITFSSTFSYTPLLFQAGGYMLEFIAFCVNQMKGIQGSARNEVIYHVLIWALLIGPHIFFSAYLIDEHLDMLLYCIAVADGLLIAIIYFTRFVLDQKIQPTIIFAQG